MPGPENSSPDDASQGPRLDTQADFDSEFDRIAAAQEGTPTSQTEDSTEQSLEARRAARDSADVPALRRMKQSARDRVRAAYPNAPGPVDAPRVPRDTEVAKLATIRHSREASDARLTQATALMQEAAHDPAKLAALYEQGQSDDPETRARAAIALSGVKHERRAERAEQLGAGIARATATARKNLHVVNKSEQMHNLLSYGGDVPRVPKRRFWQFWRP